MNHKINFFFNFIEKFVPKKSFKKKISKGKKYRRKYSTKFSKKMDDKKFKGNINMSYTIIDLGKDESEVESDNYILNKDSEYNKKVDKSQLVEYFCMMWKILRTKLKQKLKKK